MTDLPAGVTDAMVEAAGTALHDTMCKQDIDSYLSADFDCHALAQAAIAAALAVRPGWQPIDSAPQDGTEIIGLWKRNAYSLNWTQYYVKWPHEEGGPTFKGGWFVQTWDQLMPCNPTHWMPMPSTADLSAVVSPGKPG